MLPFFLILLTSFANATPFPEAPGAGALSLEGRSLEGRSLEGQGPLGEDQDLLALPAASLLHGCAAASGGLASHWALPCGAVAARTRGPSFAWTAGLAGSSADAERGSLIGQGGFLHLDLLSKAHFGAGPEVSWVTPDRPHEDLLRQRQVAPGVGVWYSPVPSLLFVGLSANTQVSTLGETWFVNALSSEARCGLSL